MPPSPPTLVHKIVAWIVVILTVVAVWKFTDYRNQPPEAERVISDK